MKKKQQKAPSVWDMISDMADVVVKAFTVSYETVKAAVTGLATGSLTVVRRAVSYLTAGAVSVCRGLAEAIRTFPRNVRLVAAFWISAWKVGIDETERRWRAGDVPEVVKADLREVLGVSPADSKPTKATGKVPVAGLN